MFDFQVHLEISACSDDLYKKFWIQDIILLFSFKYVHNCTKIL